MGLIKNALNSAKEAGKGLLGSAGGALLGGITGAANQAMFQEYFASGDMSGDVIMKRAQRVHVNGSTNTKSDANIISSGSVIDVQHNQCMIIVENGKIVEACMEPGQFTYNSSLAPSFLAGEGKFGERFKQVATEAWNQVKMGGQRHTTQRVYFINMGILDKAINWGLGNVQFRHTQRFVTNAAPYIIGIRVKGNGMAKVRVERPLEFYENYGAKYAGGDNSAVITLDSLEEFFKSCKSKLIQSISGSVTALGAKQEMMYEDIMLPENLDKIAESVNQAMLETDIGKLGFNFYQFSVNELFARDEDMLKIQNAQQQAYEVGNVNTMLHAQQMGQIAAMHEFGKNSSLDNMTNVNLGGMMGGMMGGMPMQQQYQQPQFHQQQMPQQMPMQATPNAPAADSWTCSCGAVMTGKFCNNCGAKKSEPKPVDGWTCSCGATATGKFCPECGQPKPAEKPAIEGWTCSCGAVNQGKFCQNCGSKKPADAPLYRCDKCGWQPEDPKNPPKFCPECGDRFDESDAQ